MNVAFYFCTKSTKPEQTLAYKSLAKINKKNIFYTASNKEGLSKNYNIFFNKEKQNYDSIVFLHDDVYVDDGYVIEKLQDAHNDFDIVGLAGGVNPRITSPALWHLMCGGLQSNNLRGAVPHYYGNKKIAMTSFGLTPARVAILDGLFLSVKTESVNKTDWCFNENYNFHHYDIASCLDANKKELRLGVYPIWCIHSSHGLSDINDKAFTESQKQFLQEYSNY
jgi:GT2 family glycosyltransferase